MAKEQTIFDQLLDKLGGYVSGWSANLFRALRKAHEKEPLPYTSEWGDSFDREYKEPPAFEDSSTYDEGINWEIQKGRNVTISIYRMCCMGEERRGIKYTFRFKKVPRHLLMPYVKASLRRKAAHMESLEEEKRRENRCAAIYKKLLNCKG